MIYFTIFNVVFCNIELFINNMKIISVGVFDIIKLNKLVDENAYLQKVLEFINGYWRINIENTKEIERLLKKNIIKYKIKII